MLLLVTRYPMLFPNRASSNTHSSHCRPALIEKRNPTGSGQALVGPRQWSLQSSWLQPTHRAGGICEAGIESCHTSSGLSLRGFMPNSALTHLEQNSVSAPGVMTEVLLPLPPLSPQCSWPWSLCSDFMLGFLDQAS